MRRLGLDRHDRWVAFKSLIFAGAAVALIALLFVGFGGVDVAADKPHSWLTYRLLHFAFGQSVGLRASSIVPPDDLDSTSRIRLGAQQFHLVCSNCHGGPGLGQSPLALSMEPRPQSLPAVVGQFDDAELFWILQHGVKFSAMPSWSTKTRDDEVWSMVAFVRKLPTMTAAAYLDLTAPRPSPSGASVPPFSAPASLRPADTSRNPSWQAPEEYLYAVPALGFGDRSVMGDALAMCGRCHDADGTGGVTGGEAPNLTLQDPEYIRASLGAYATGNRRSGFMQPVAAQLSVQQIASLADWYARSPERPRSSSAPPADPEVEARGRKIANEGLTSVALPACVTCHQGEARTKIGAPRLEGQSEVFIRRQLTAMRDGNRGSTRFWNPMPGVARHLTDADIEAIAAYYGSQPPEDRTASPSVASLQPSVGDRAKGEQMFGAICARCHTPQALGDEAGDIPDLTLQLPGYVASALRAFRSGERLNSRMHLVAQDLDDGEIEALAAYVGGLTPQAAHKAAGAAASDRGAAIVEKGIADRAVPACLTCHAADTTAALPLIPRLPGQNADYLRKRLDYFASPQADQISALNPMPLIARKLSETERADLAAYLAAGSPLDKQSAPR